MTIRQFHRLPDDEQWDYIWNNGTFLENVKFEERSYSLYALGEWYVEVQICNYENKVLGKQLCKNGTILDKYSVGFDIDVN